MMALMEILCNSVPEVNARLSVHTSAFFAKAVSLFVHTGKYIFVYNECIFILCILQKSQCSLW